MGRLEYRRAAASAAAGSVALTLEEDGGVRAVLVEHGRSRRWRGRTDPGVFAELATAVRSWPSDERADAGAEPQPRWLTLKGPGDAPRMSRSAPAALDAADGHRMAVFAVLDGLVAHLVRDDGDAGRMVSLPTVVHGIGEEGEEPGDGAAPGEDGEAVVCAAFGAVQGVYALGRADGAVAVLPLPTIYQGVDDPPPVVGEPLLLDGHAAPVTALAVGAAAEPEAAGGEDVDGGADDEDDEAARSALLAAGARDGALHLWELADQPSRRHATVGHHGPIRSAAVVPVGDGLLVSGGQDGRVLAWDAATGLPGPGMAGREGAVTRLAVVGDRFVVSAGDDGVVRLSDAVAGEARDETLAEGWVDAVAAYPHDGREVVAFAGADGAVRLWTPRMEAGAGTQASPVTAAVGHDAPVRALLHTAEPGPGLLVSADTAGVVRLHHPGSGASLGTLPDPYAGAPASGVEVLAAAAHPGGVGVAVGRRDGTVDLYAVAGDAGADSDLTIRHLGSRHMHQGWVTGLRIQPSGSTEGAPTGYAGGLTVVSTGTDGRLARWTPGSEPLRDPLAAAPLLALTDWTSGPAAACAVAGADGSVWLVDGTTPGAALPHPAAVTVVVAGVLAERRVLLAGAADGTLRLWDAADATPGPVPTPHTAEVTAVDVGSWDGRRAVVTASADRTTRVWDASDGRPLACTVAAGPVTAAVWAVTEDGPRVAFAVTGDGVRLWDPRGTEDPVTVTADEAAALAAGPGHDGAWLAVGSAGTGTVTVWPLAALPAAAAASGDASGKALTVPRREVRAHRGRVSTLVVGLVDDDAAVVSGGMDGVVRNHDPATLRQRRAGDAAGPVLALGLARQRVLVCTTERVAAL